MTPRANAGMIALALALAIAVIAVFALQQGPANPAHPANGAGQIAPAVIIGLVAGGLILLWATIDKDK